MRQVGRLARLVAGTIRAGRDGGSQVNYVSREGRIVAPGVLRRDPLRPSEVGRIGLV